MATTSVTAEVIAYLKTKTTIRVASEVPTNTPTQLITVAQIGGAGDRHLDSPRVDVDTFGSSDLEASTLGDTVRDWLYDLPGTSQLISHVERSTFYRSDIDGHHKWTATYLITRNT